MGIFDFALKKKEEEKKQPLGSSFGGGWGLSDLVNEQKKKELSPSITSNMGAGAGVKTEGSIGQFDFALKTPEPEIITQKEQALAKVEETFSTLDKSIETNYKRYQELGTQLDSLETELAEAPEELKWNLSLKYENLRNEHNKLVEQLQTDTEQQKKVYADYNVIRNSYEKDLELYNRKVEAQNKQVKQQHQDYLDTSRLSGSMAKGEELPKTREQQLIDKFTTPPEKATVGGMVGISEPLDLSTLPDPVKKVIQAIGGTQGFRITEPQLYNQAMEVKNEIYKYADPLERIAKAHEMMTGEPMEEALKELQGYEPPKPEQEFKPTWLKWRGDDPAVYGKSAFGLVQLSPKKLPEKYEGALGLVSQASQFTTTEQVGNFLQTASRNVLIGNMAYSGIKSIYEAGKVYEARNVYDTKINKVIEKAKNVFDKQKAGKGILPGEYLNKNELEIFGNAFNHFMETGQYPTSMTVIRPNFLGQAGHLSLPNMVKAIQNAGKISPDMRNQIATMTLINRIELMNQLAKIDPTLTATLATDFSDVLKAPETPQAQQEPETPLPTDRPDIPIPQRQEIEAKVDEVIAQEIPKIQAKFPDITLPEIKEQIIPKVEEEINKIVPPRAEVKMPEITIPQKEILAKVEQVVKEELSKLKYEAKKPEMAIPEKEVVSTDTPAPKPVEAEAQPDWFKPDKETVAEVAKAPDPIAKIQAIKNDTQKALDSMIDNHAQYLKETSGKGVDSGLIPTEDSFKKTRYAVSQNPVWYQELYRSLGKTPTKADLRVEAERQLSEGYENIPADANFIKLQSQVEAWEIAEEELESMDLAEPKVIERVIEKIVERQAKAPKPKHKSIKTQIREVTGQTPPPKIEIRERDILKYVLRGEQRVARDIFNKGKEEGIFQANEKFENRLQRIQERKDIKELRQEIREQEKQDKIAALKKSNTPSNIVDKKSDALIYSGQKNNNNPITIQENKILGYVLKGEARAARQAFSEGKKEGIFEQKEHFEDVVARAKERKAKSQEINKIKDIVKNANLKELRPERKANIEKIINDLDLSRMTGKTQAKLTSRLDYVRENPDNQIPIERLDELARLNKKPIADLTADEIRNIKDAILHEIHLNKLKNKLEFGRQIKDANEVLKIARENVLKGGKGLKDDPGAIIDSGETEHRSLWQKLKNFWGIDSLNTEVICEELDHGDHGEIMKYVYTGIDKGVTDKLKVMQDADDWFTKELEGINIAKWSKSFQQKKSDIDFQTIKLKGGTSLDGKQLPDKKIKITKGERISFLLHNQNNKNLAHLTGGGFRFSDKPSAKYRLTEENIKQIVDSATPEEKKVAKAISKFFNEYMKPKINDASMKLNGFEVATEDNYFPIRTLELDRQRDALKAKRTFHHKTLEGMGIFKDRTNATNALIIEDAFNVVVKHLEQTSSYIGLAKPLRYARFIVEDTELQENVMKNHGKEYLDNLKNYLNIIEDESTNVENFDKLTSELINKLDPAVLGLHIFIGFKQPVSYIAASTQIETKYLDKGFSIKTNVAEIKKYSPQLRQRFEGHVTRELGELGSVGKTRQFFLHKSPVNAKYLKGIMYMDGLTIGKIWNAVKLEISDKYPDLTGEEYMQKVTERAEEVIRRTQPTWHPKDRSYIGRSRSMWLRLATKYSSQRNKNWIIVKRAILRYNRSGKTNKDKIRLASDVGKVYVVMAALIAAIDAVRDKVYGRKGKGILGFAIDTLLTALGTFYIVGDLASSMISKIQRGTYAGFDSMGNIVASWVDGGINGIAELVRGISQLEEKEKYKSGTKKGEEKYKTTMLRALNEMASFTLSTKGIPYDNVRRLLEGTLKMAGDKEEPKKTTTTIKPPSSKPPGYLKPTGTPPSGTPPGGIKKPAGKPPGY